MGSLRGLLKYRNPDSTLDLNRRLFGVIAKGAYDGDVQSHQTTTPLVVPVPSVLQVQVNPFVAMGADGMVVLHEGTPEFLPVTAGVDQYVVLRSKYNSSGDPLITIGVLTAAAYAVDPDRTGSFLGQTLDFLLVLARIQLNGGDTSVSASQINFKENQIVNSLGRTPFRGHVANAAALPVHPLSGPATGDQFNVTGDIMLAIAESQLYRWNVSSWATITDGAVAAGLAAHIASLTAHPAANITFNNAYGGSNISATDVQGGLSEVDLEKVAKAGDTMSGTLTITPVGAGNNGLVTAGKAATSGSGVAGTGGSADGAGLSGTGGATNGVGVRGQGTGLGDGVFGTPSATDGSAGVHGTGSANPNSPGVLGTAASKLGTGVTGTSSIKGFGGDVINVGGGDNNNGGPGITSTGGNVTGTAGSGSGGIGVSATGGTANGSGTGGRGGVFTGGSPNGVGIVGTGDATGVGVQGLGGATNGTGGTFTGGNTNGTGLVAAGKGAGNAILALLSTSITGSGITGSTAIASLGGTAVGSGGTNNGGIGVDGIGGNATTAGVFNTGGTGIRGSGGTGSGATSNLGGVGVVGVGGTPNGVGVTGTGAISAAVAVPGGDGARGIGGAASNTLGIGGAGVTGTGGTSVASTGGAGLHGTGGVGTGTTNGGPGVLATAAAPALTNTALSIDGNVSWTQAARTFRRDNSGVNTSLTNLVYTNVTFPAVSDNVGITYSSPDITFTFAGTYLISYFVPISVLGTGLVTLFSRAKLNNSSTIQGTTASWQNGAVATTPWYANLASTFIYTATAGDTLRVQVFSSSAAAGPNEIISIADGSNTNESQASLVVTRIMY